MPFPFCLFFLSYLFHVLCWDKYYRVATLELLKPLSLRGINPVVCVHICGSFLPTWCVWFWHLSHFGRNVGADYQKQSSSRPMMTFDKSEEKEKRKVDSESAFQLVCVCLRPSKASATSTEHSRNVARPSFVYRTSPTMTCEDLPPQHHPPANSPSIPLSLPHSVSPVCESQCSHHHPTLCGETRPSDVWEC